MSRATAWANQCLCSLLSWFSFASLVVCTSRPFSLRNIKEEQKAKKQTWTCVSPFFKMCIWNESSNHVRAWPPHPPPLQELLSLILKSVTSSTADVRAHEPCDFFGISRVWSHLPRLPLKVHVVPGGNLPLLSEQVGWEELEREVGACGYKGLERETRTDRGNIKRCQQLSNFTRKNTVLIKKKKANNWCLKAEDTVRRSNYKLFF